MYTVSSSSLLQLQNWSVLSSGRSWNQALSTLEKDVLVAPFGDYFLLRDAIIYIFFGWFAVLLKSVKREDDKPFRDCADAYQAGFNKSGVYTIYVNNVSEPKKVKRKRLLVFLLRCSERCMFVSTIPMHIYSVGSFCSLPFTYPHVTVQSRGSLMFPNGTILDLQDH